MYDLNSCAPLWDSLFDGTPLRVYRILFTTELLLLYLCYNIITFIFFKTINSLKVKDKAEEQTQVIVQQLNKWRGEYLLMLGDHTVAVGFVMSFSPYQLQIALTIIHIILRIVYELRLHRWGQETKKIKTCLRIINLTLLLCAMVGVSRMTFQTSGACDDTTYQIL